MLLAGATASDLRDIMVEGESGVMSVARSFRPHYEPSKSRLTWPNGATALLLSADEPDRFRGKQAEVAWADELASWRYPEAWDQLLLGLRLGARPRAVVTTTPRPTSLIKDLMRADTTHVTRGSSYANKANLAPDFFRQIVSKYEGTRLGRQELYAEILDDVPGALVRREMITYASGPQTMINGQLKPSYLRVVVAIDPAVSYGPDSDETGLLVVAKGIDANGYVLDDQSGRYSPQDWGRRAIGLAEQYGADAIIGEVNNGGDMVESTLRSVGWNGRFIRVTASRGKRVRAEPISAGYERQLNPQAPGFRIFHVRPFAELEDQWCNFTPDSPVSPDHVDAEVWGFTELFPTVTHVEGPFSMIG